MTLSQSELCQRAPHTSAGSKDDELHARLPFAYQLISMHGGCYSRCRGSFGSSDVRLNTLLCGAVLRALAGEALRWRAAWAGAAVSAVILNITPTAAGYYLRLVAGRTPVEVFLVLAGVLITCYLAAFGLLLGAGVAARVQLGQQLHG